MERKLGNLKSLIEEIKEDNKDILDIAKGIDGKEKSEVDISNVRMSDK